MIYRNPSYEELHKDDNDKVYGGVCRFCHQQIPKTPTVRQRIIGSSILLAALGFTDMLVNVVATLAYNTPTGEPSPPLVHILGTIGASLFLLALVAPVCYTLWFTVMIVLGKRSFPLP